MQVYVLIHYQYSELIFRLFIYFYITENILDHNTYVYLSIYILYAYLAYVMIRNISPACILLSFLQQSAKDCGKSRPRYTHAHTHSELRTLNVAKNFEIYGWIVWSHDESREREEVKKQKEAENAQTVAEHKHGVFCIVSRVRKYRFLSRDLQKRLLQRWRLLM